LFVVEGFNRQVSIRILIQHPHPASYPASYPQPTVTMAFPPSTGGGGGNGKAGKKSKAGTGGGGGGGGGATKLPTAAGGGKKRGSGRSASGKKKCPHGADCKYQREYQHQLEFHHNESEKELADKQKNAFEAFSGQGQVMASSSASANNTGSLSFGNGSGNNGNNRLGGGGTIHSNPPQLQTPWFTTAIAAHKRTTQQQKQEPRSQVQLNVDGMKEKSNPSKISNGDDDDDFVVMLDESVELVEPPVAEEVAPTAVAKGASAAGVIHSNQMRTTNTSGAAAFASQATIDLCDSDDEDEDAVAVVKVSNSDSKLPAAGRKRPRPNPNLTPADSDNMIDITDSPPIISHTRRPQAAGAIRTQPRRDMHERGVPLLPGLTRQQQHHLEQQQMHIERQLHVNHLQKEDERQMSHAVAQSNRVVTHAQDAEYHESLRRDQEKERQLKDEKEETRVIEESTRLQQEKDEREKDEKADQAEREEEERHQRQEQATQALEEEPPTSDTTAVTVAFKLPRRCAPQRLIRRFSSKATAEQLHLYLQSRSDDELKGIDKWQLRQVVGHTEIPTHSTSSLNELGLVPRGLLVVKEIEHEQDEWL
jgi:hypothetical protein